MHKTILWIVAILVCIVAVQSVAAQATCPDLVLNAVETVGASCGEIGRNNVCYGNYRVDAVLTRAMGVEFFDAPADQIQLVDVRSLNTAPLDLEREEWGIAVMNIQANLPEVLPGQVVTMLVIGDAEIQNDAPLNLADLPIVPILTATSMYSQPDTNSGIISPLDVGASVQVAGMTASGDWLRVTTNGLFGWIDRIAIDPLSVLGDIPIIDGQTPLPMQSFTFRAGIGGPRCAEAPPSVLVMQGPEQVRVSLTVNGVGMELGSTAVLWHPADQVMQLAVLDGQVQLDNGTAITRGFTAEVLLDEDEQATGVWTQPRPLTVFEVAALLPLQNLPDTMLNYPINVPEEGEPSPTPHATYTFTPSPTRVIQPTRQQPRPTAIPPSPVPSEPIVVFTADSQIIEPGDCTVLRWYTENIDSVYIDGQPTIGEGSQEVCHRQTTTHVLLVRFRDGTEQTYSLTIQVQVPISTPVPQCGNQLCEAGESMMNCTVDCREPVCGNFVCEPGESFSNCSADCLG
jgi:hypothetical protein